MAVKAVGSRHATRGAWRGVVAALPVVKTHNAGGIRLRPTQHIVAQMPCERGRVEYRCGLGLYIFDELIPYFLNPRRLLDLLLDSLDCKIMRM